ncbi:enolase C-terminal domain-like protein [Bacteroidota bacterium]
MDSTIQNNVSNLISRRTALKLALTATLIPFVPACKTNSPVISQVNVIRVKKKSDEDNSWTYLEITTNNGVSGYGGPLISTQAQSLEKLLPQLRKLIVDRDPMSREIDFEWIWNQLYPDKQLSNFQNGIDPLSGKTIWNIRRNERHTSTGKIITGLSAVDNALWDIRGKLSDEPVYRLLGGNRERLRAYMSLRPDDNISETVKLAKDLYDQGQTAQKWFFRYGPPDGKPGFSKIAGLAEGLRTELGEDALLMFDFAVGQRGRCDWDVDYAIRVAKAIQPFNPTWLEEPFSPEEIESYRRLRGETDIPLATGEHTYSRWNIRPFLEENLVSFVQSDPEWCGGISELLKICKLVNEFGNIRVIPHGHHIPAASHVVASQPELLCPMVEFGPNWVLRHQGAQTRVISPEAGYISTPQEPGLGPSIDWERFEKVNA